MVIEQKNQRIRWSTRSYSLREKGVFRGGRRPKRIGPTPRGWREWPPPRSPHHRFLGDTIRVAVENPMSTHSPFVAARRLLYLRNRHFKQSSKWRSCLQDIHELFVGEIRSNHLLGQAATNQQTLQYSLRNNISLTWQFK